MHARRAGEGIHVPALAAPLSHLVVRTFDMGGGVGARDRQLVEASPLLAVLSSPGDTPRDWLHTGMALQRVLLVACREGLQVSYLNQPIQVDALRGQLGALVNEACPQLLLRLGYPKDSITHAARRPLDHVIEVPIDR
jgi:hypothetical protein